MDLNLDQPERGTGWGHWCCLRSHEGWACLCWSMWLATCVCRHVVYVCLCACASWEYTLIFAACWMCRHGAVVTSSLSGYWIWQPPNIARFQSAPTLLPVWLISDLHALGFSKISFNQWWKLGVSFKGYILRYRYIFVDILMDILILDIRYIFFFCFWESFMTIFQLLLRNEFTINKNNSCVQAFPMQSTCVPPSPH